MTFESKNCPHENRMKQTRWCKDPINFTIYINSKSRLYFSNLEVIFFKKIINSQFPKIFGHKSLTNFLVLFHLINDMCPNIVELTELTELLHVYSEPMVHQQGYSPRKWNSNERHLQKHVCRFPTMHKMELTGKTPIPWYHHKTHPVKTK